MSCASRHHGRTAWRMPARNCGLGNGGDCVQQEPQLLTQEIACDTVATIEDALALSDKV